MSLKFLGCLFSNKSLNIFKDSIHNDPPSKKKGLLCALAASVALLGAIFFTTIGVVGFGLAIAAFVSGPIPLGVLQLISTITTLSVAALLTFMAYNAIKNAQYHFGGRSFEDLGKELSLGK